ncbi:MAG: alpha/beta fold hydrolase [bacterium]
MKMFLLFCAIVSIFIPSNSQARPLQSSQSDTIVVFAEEFIDFMVKGDFSRATARFDSTMKKVSPPEELEKFWAGLIQQRGAFKRRSDIRTESFQEYDFVFVTCEFEQSSIDLKVVFNNRRQIAGLWLVPTPTPPSYSQQDAFYEKETTIGEGDWTLPGTLTLPQGNGPFPAVVLVHGSGPQDRDETIGPNKPFRDIAWGLAGRGIAVLRYEKRTRVYSKKLASMKTTFTVKEETVEDALAAASALRKTAEIDPRRIFVLGHSLGGMVVPRIGTADPNIEGFIILAGTTRALEDIIIEQIAYIASLKPNLSKSDSAQINSIKQAVAKIKALDPSDAVSNKQYLIGAPPSYWLDLREYDPPRLAQSLRRPMLILQGERDYQVTMVDFENWKVALGSRKDVEFKSYPGLNHLFIEGKGRITPEEYNNAGHVAEVVIEDIARWIKKSL